MKFVTDRSVYIVCVLGREMVIEMVSGTSNTRSGGETQGQGQR